MLTSRTSSHLNYLQVGILDNNRVGNCYAVIIAATRDPLSGKEDAVTEAYNNSQGIPFIPGTLSQGGISIEQCFVVQTKQVLPVDTMTDILSKMLQLDADNLKYMRCLMIPLGTNQWSARVNSEQIIQINSDLRQYTVCYYDYVHGATPSLIQLGKIQLPNPERYCDFKDGVFSSEEVKDFINTRTKATLAVSHGMPVVTRFDVRMVDMIPHTAIQRVKYKKQTGEMVDLLTEDFEKKVARVRGIETFKFSSRFRVSKLLDDFNQGQLPPPAWSFSAGMHLALSVQHDFHYLSNPKHPYLANVNPQYIDNIKGLMHPMPAVYFSYFSELETYGVFAAKDLLPNTCIDIYAGDFTDNHSHPMANCYCYRPQIPGYQYGYCQGVYALDSGNTTTLINSAAEEGAQGVQTPGLKANVCAYLQIYKKTPIFVYFTSKHIPKDTQLLINYEELMKTDCPRHFTFFGNGATICATKKTQEYYKQDIEKGQQYYKEGNYLAAKKSFRTAYALTKACYTQFSAADAAKIRLLFASTCEYLSSAYHKLDNIGKAIKYLEEAILLRQGLPKQTPANQERIKNLNTKLDQIGNQRQVKMM